MSVTNIPSGMHIQVDPLMFRDAETIESYTPAGLSPWIIVCHLVTPNTGCPLKLGNSNWRTFALCDVSLPSIVCDCMRIRIQDTSVYCVCVYVGPIGSFYFCASGVFEAMLEALRRLSPEKCSDVPSLKLGSSGATGATGATGAKNIERCGQVPTWWYLTTRSS